MVVARKGPEKFFFLCLTILLILMPEVPTAFAYYSLNPVSIDLASSSISIAKGSDGMVVCTVDPKSEQQLPGCGMAGCPKTCGEGCLDSNGWCQCAGTTYTTYFTTTTVTSSAPTVARASYSGGILRVRGYSVGTATITVTAKLAKHRNATATLVAVITSNKGKSSSGNSSGSNAGSGSEPSSSTGHLGSGVAATSASGDSEAANSKGVSVTSVEDAKSSSQAKASESVSTGDSSKIGGLTPISYASSSVSIPFSTVLPVLLFSVLVLVIGATGRWYLWARRCGKLPTFLTNSKRK